MLFNTNVQQSSVPTPPKYPEGAPITDDALLFVLKPKDYVFFHDRIRGVAFSRGDAKQPLPHRYMVGVSRAVGAMKGPRRALAARHLPERYRP
jgi:hypothetical protein